MCTYFGSNVLPLSYRTMNEISALKTEALFSPRTFTRIPNHATSHSLRSVFSYYFDDNLICHTLKCFTLRKFSTVYSRNKPYGGRNGSVGTATRLQTGRSGNRIPVRGNFPHPSRAAMELTQPPAQCVLGHLRG